MAEEQEGVQEKYLLPSEKYSPEQLKEIYVPKGAEDNDPVGSLPYDSVFMPLMDRILGGMSPRKCSRWLNVAFGVRVKYTDIQRYIERYIPQEVKVSLNFASKTYQNSKVDPIEIMEDQIRWQKERINKAKNKAETDAAFAVAFPFRKEIELLHRMSMDLLEKKQDLGLLPKVPAGVVSAAPPDEPEADAADMVIKEDMNNLNPSQLGRLAHILDSLKSKLKDAAIDAEVIKTPEPPNA